MSAREIRCPDCGATRKVLDDAMMLVCEYCGAFIGVSTSIQSRMAAGRKAIEMFQNPTEASRRFMDLAQRMPAAQQSGDREAFRTIAQEYYSLYAVLYPENVVGQGQEAIAGWVRDAVTTGELNYFDPQVKPRFDGYTGAIAAMTTGGGDPVQAGGAALEASRRYYQALLGHPQCPQGLAGKNPQKLAAQMLETSLTGMTSVMGQEAIEKIRSRVLGQSADDSSSVCPECGAPLEEISGDHCPYCGSVLVRKDSDPWVTEQVALFEQVKASSPQFNQDTALFTAVGFIYNAVRVDPAFPADRAVRFLKQVVPWATPARIMEKARLTLAAEGSHFLGPLQQALASSGPQGTG